MMESGARRSTLLLHARGILQNAEGVMDNRVQGFRVPEMRVSGWRQGPTTYPYGYIWSAKTLYVFEMLPALAFSFYFL